MLYYLLLCIPISTAVVERGFSSIRRILDDWRANLAVETVNQLVHISTRKEEFTSKALREELINAVATNFIKGDGTSEILALQTDGLINY